MVLLSFNSSSYGMNAGESVGVLRKIHRLKPLSLV